jgi:preprotein translocase subunit SecD
VHVEVDSTQVSRDEYVLRPLAPGLRSQPLADVVDHLPVRLALRIQPVIDLSHISSAEAAFVDEFGEYTVWVALTREGVDRLAEATAEVVGRRLGIVWDGEVISMPLIRSPMRSAWRIPIYYSCHDRMQTLW